MKLVTYYIEARFNSYGLFLGRAEKDKVFTRKFRTAIDMIQLILEACQKLMLIKTFVIERA